MRKSRMQIKLESKKKDSCAFSVLELQFNVQPVVLYVLVSIAVSNTSNTMSLFYQNFLSDVNDMGTYAWGATMIATMHCNMQQILISIQQEKSGGRATKEKKTLYGNFHFVTCFLSILKLFSWNVIAREYGGVQNQEEEITAPQDANNPMQQQDDQLEQGTAGQQQEEDITQLDL
ncbi:hypothetical protein V6N12_032850 [Hibiscus sabdariffa]|uniref:Aminotransferase-like plant mobile domain-containing protein n=1 Tax=Hibiscus sabdariffa TaxID=183260 RepID=A0ABR2BB54_9ROSI